MGRFGLIDNSTLTAVQRLKGEIEVVNKYCLDGDILALETLVQSILFCDELYYVDDYKEEYRLKRENSFPFLSSISFEKEDYNWILDRTRERMKKVIPTLSRGEYVDETYAPFFELLKMNNIYTWDLSSSEFYLTQKMLRDTDDEIDLKEYNSLQQMIFGETLDFFEREKNPQHIILDSHGNVLTSAKEKETPQTKLFLADLSWLAFRTIFYTLVANQVGGTLVLHPIRNAFQMSYLQSVDSVFDSTYRSLLNAMNSATDEKIREVFNASLPLVSKYILPMFSIYLSSNANSIDELLNMALHMKHEGKFVSARAKMEEIECLLEDNSKKGVKDANKLLFEVNKTLTDLGAKYYVGTAQGVPLSPIIQTYNLALGLSGGILPKLPEVDIVSKALGKAKSIIPKTGFNAVYKSLINELATIGKIGSYYEKLTKDVSFSENAGYYSAKIEEQKYRNVESFWKKPMDYFC